MDPCHKMAPGFETARRQKMIELTLEMAERAAKAGLGQSQATGDGKEDGTARRAIIAG